MICSYLFNVPYGAGKTAIDRMTSDMAYELSSSGVTVVTLWPGAVRTELIMNSLKCAGGDWGKVTPTLLNKRTCTGCELHVSSRRVYRVRWKGSCLPGSRPRALQEEWQNPDNYRFGQLLRIQRY